MFLDRLESGVLLLQTQQGLIPVELSFRQRIYLLWTFRNFRRLSPPLLNSRQVALINDLARNSANFVSHYDPWLVIGVVENFALPAAHADSSAITNIDTSQAMTKERPQTESVITECAGTVPSESHCSAARNVAWSKLARSWLTTIRQTMISLASPKLASVRFRASWFATAVATFVLCIISVVAWHRIQSIPNSEAHNQPRPQQNNSFSLSNSAQLTTPVAVQETRTAVARPATAAQSPPAREGAADSASVKPASMPAAVIPDAKQRIRVHDATSVPKPAFSPDGAIRATRLPSRFVYPIYSDVSTRGVVTLIAGVDSDGTVRTVRVVSGNRALAAAAVRAIRQWRYGPYIEDGHSVATETNIVISFFSGDAISMSFPRSIPSTR